MLVKDQYCDIKRVFVFLFFSQVAGISDSRKITVWISSHSTLSLFQCQQRGKSVNTDIYIYTRISHASPAKHTGVLSVSFSSDISCLVLPVTDIMAGVFDGFIYEGNLNRSCP